MCCYVAYQKREVGVEGWDCAVVVLCGVFFCIYLYPFFFLLLLSSWVRGSDFFMCDLTNENVFLCVFGQGYLLFLRDKRHFRDWRDGIVIPFPQWCYHIHSSLSSNYSIAYHSICNTITHLTYMSISILHRSMSKRRRKSPRQTRFSAGAIYARGVYVLLPNPPHCKNLINHAFSRVPYISACLSFYPRSCLRSCCPLPVQQLVKPYKDAWVSNLYTFPSRV